MWIRLENLERPEPGEVVRVKAQGVAMALANHDGCLHALEDRCPHAGAMLSTGTVVDGRLVCPWHGREYELDSGRCDGYAGVAAYAVQERVDGVYVQTDPKAMSPAVPSGTP